MPRPVSFPLLLALTIAVPAAAQERGRAVTAPPGGQLSDGAPRGAAADQISAARRGRQAVDQLAGDSRVRPAASQVSTPAASRQPAPGQVTTERRRAGGTPQLTTARPSAAAPASSSARADSRPSGVVRVAGRDRCDPATALGQSRACADVIEARAAEYQAPAAPVLSPEQRLLLTQDPAQAPGLRGAAERIARNDVDPDAADTQTLAAITREPVILREPARADTPLSPTDAAVADLIGQIIGAAQALPPR